MRSHFSLNDINEDHESANIKKTLQHIVALILSLLFSIVTGCYILFTIFVLIKRNPVKYCRRFLCSGKEKENGTDGRPELNTVVTMTEMINPSMMKRLRTISTISEALEDDYEGTRTGEDENGISNPRLMERIRAISTIVSIEMEPKPRTADV